MIRVALRLCCISLGLLQVDQGALVGSFLGREHLRFVFCVNG